MDCHSYCYYSSIYSADGDGYVDWNDVVDRAKIVLVAFANQMLDS